MIAVRASLPRAALVALASLPGTVAAAQQPTNRDQSHYTELLRGGFPIRAEVVAVEAREAKLKDDDLVIGVVAGGEARAYPVNLMWEPENEVLNDTLGGQQITATWCPIAHTAAVFDRTVEGSRLELGAVGLRDGVSILYDRGTGSWWSQVSGRAVEGPLAGRTLGKRAASVTTWAAWRRLHPETTVWWDSALPGRRRFTEESMSRIALGGGGAVSAADLVIGVEGARGGARAYLVRGLAAAGGVVNDSLDGEPLLVHLAEDLVSVSVRSRRLGERVLTFEAGGSLVRDRETGSAWDPRSGLAQDGRLAGRALGELVHTPALWYAWRSQRPDTTLWPTAP
jgi:hypothetical protein